ncbi:MAG: endonuclease/exonuclease/phosphatase family protein [Colwellia sp.]
MNNKLKSTLFKRMFLVFYLFSTSLFSFLLFSISLMTTSTAFATTMTKTLPLSTVSNEPTKLRIATFNVSMEALNYIETVKGQRPDVKGTELSKALKEDNQQIKNIAEIIQRVNPDIILLNEFDRENDSDVNIKYFLQQYLAVGQKNQQGIQYPYFYQGSVNTGVKSKFDLNNNGISQEAPADTYGFGYFPGHFGMVLLSKYPLDENNIRTFQHFKWHNMPNALQTINPETQKLWYSQKAWLDLPLSSKSHWDIPITVNGQVIHILASHPTPPVFDGPENRNGKRNHDEIRFWLDYITPLKGDYIYDDKQNFGSLASGEAFVILGDQNASNVEGDAINSAIGALLNSPLIQDAKPKSQGGKDHSKENKYAENHTAYWRMRADYVLPSKAAWKITDSAVFWPLENDDAFRLIANRKASSDHRLVWVDLELTAN